METYGTGSAPQAGGNPASRVPRGFAEEILSLLGSLGRHFSAVTALAGEEAREAAELYIRLAVVLGAALLFAAFGYALFLFFVTFALAFLLGVPWAWVLLGLALLHFVIAGLCAFHVKTHWQTPIFTATKTEIGRDLDALKPKA